jgi:hypothetical protein
MSEDRRFVDIVSRGPRTSGYGSGFLLGEGLVLTARHVLMPADADFALGEVTVRNVDMVKHGEARVPAKLVWPDDPALLKVHKPDIALIRVADHPSFPHRWPLIRIHGLGDDDREWPMVFNYEVHAVGFPEFAIMQGRPPTERDTRQLSGRTRNGDGQVRGQFLIVDAAFSDPANAQNRRWSGFFRLGPVCRQSRRGRGDRVAGRRHRPALR